MTDNLELWNKLGKTVRDLLDYNADTGEFFWKVPRGNRRIGSPAGSPDPKGYIVIIIGRRHCLAHRLAWLWMTGEWPNECIDHIDGDRGNNRWVNLREATYSQNNMNRTRNQRALPQGVYPSRERFVAQLNINGKRRHLGVFATPEDAHEAYQQAATHYYGEYFHVR